MQLRVKAYRINMKNNFRSLMSDKFSHLERFERESLVYLNSVKEQKDFNLIHLPHILSIYRSHKNNDKISIQFQVTCLQILEKFTKVAIDDLARENLITEYEKSLSSSNIYVQKAALICINRMVQFPVIAGLLSSESVELIAKLSSIESFIEISFSIFSLIVTNSEDKFELIFENIQNLNERLSDIKSQRSVIAFIGTSAKSVPKAAKLYVEMQLIPLLWKEAYNHRYPRQIVQAITCIASHNLELALQTLTDNFQDVLRELLIKEDLESRNIAMLYCMTCCRHGGTVCEKFINFIEPFVVPYLKEMPSDLILSCIITVGCIAATSMEFSANVKQYDLLDELLDLMLRPNFDLKTNIVWCLTHMGKHSTEDCDKIAEKGFVNIVFKVMISSSDTELIAKCDRFLKVLIPICSNDLALVGFLSADTKPSILLIVLERLVILLKNPDQKKKFMKGGYLHKTQELRVIYTTQAASLPILDAIMSINNLYPGEIVQFCSPEYGLELIETLDEYVVPNTLESLKTGEIKY
eukprot:NODE_3_length_80033_cov_0.932970.p12 type:complete len:525 gc:universal NODE_3_length_80033_cov_0.932970:60590-62164(+)